MERITDSILGRKESDVELEVEENVEICPKSEEDEQVITEAEPLAWRPPAPDHVHSQVQPPLLVPSYVDGNIFDLPEGWIMERRPRTSLKYLGKVEKVVSLPFNLFHGFNLMFAGFIIVFVLN
ncbi:hypothetical protein V6N13_006050 [Hibiscus sabdariffa]|uniref:Uncharacterized protein n=1 Tax=Hibiscus sabdariffa TaxID=183260 RepID=A0ABR2ENY5_9ROSI